MIKKHFCLVLFLLSVFSMIISLNMFNKEQIVLNINSKNKSSFKEAIKDDEINDIDAINKVKLGQGWHSGELYIYRTFQKAEKIIVTEGNFRFTNLQKYVIEHGYSLDKYGMLFFIISIISMVFCIVLKIMKNKIY